MPCGKRAMVSASASGVTSPSACSMVMSFMPVWNSVALHSSIWMCASLLQKTKPPGRISEASASELEAVPVAVNQTSTGVSNSSENRSVTRAVIVCAPAESSGAVTVAPAPRLPSRFDDQAIVAERSPSSGSLAAPVITIGVRNAAVAGSAWIEVIVGGDPGLGRVTTMR